MRGLSLAESRLVRVVQRLTADVAVVRGPVPEHRAPSASGPTALGKPTLPPFSAHAVRGEYPSALVCFQSAAASGGVTWAIMTSVSASFAFWMNWLKSVVPMGNCAW